MNVTFWNFPPTLVVTNDKNNVSRAPRSDMKTKKSLFGEVFNIAFGNISGKLIPNYA
jgi:hypothetical protein